MRRKFNHLFKRLLCFKNLNHRDHSILIESACQLHDVKMTRHELLLKGLISADLAERLYNKNFEALIKKQPNLG